MRIPKGTDIRVDTSTSPVEVHIVGNITTKAQANELIAAIRQCAALLEGERRVRKPKVEAA